MYSLADYGVMVTDRSRMDAYARAVRQSVVAGSVVVDIGTGTGIVALLACRAGARKVYAIEPSDVIGVAREIAAANGCADRIEFIQDVSTRVALPEQADVIVSDLRGVLPLFGAHLPSIADARRRFMKPAGVLIPHRDRLWAAVVSAPEQYRRHVEPWERNGFGLDMRAARHIETNTFTKCRLRADQLACRPQCWSVLDYTVVDCVDSAGRAAWTIDSTVTAHGIAIWFDSTLAPGIEMSNAPGGPEFIYGQAFFPWPRTVPLVPGDDVSVSIDARLVGGDYTWRWDSRIRGEQGALKADFRQCTFFGEMLSAATLARRSADHLPALNDSGRLDRFILGRLDAQARLGRIADEVLAEFPTRFASWNEALAHVGDLSSKYSR